MSYKSCAMNITGSWVRGTDRVMRLMLSDANTGQCVEVQLDNNDIARLRRSIAALDKKYAARKKRK